ncbi:SDR family NAD(P)-dependent oxidoreductase [Hellea balneolensis]|uniref:SDR family NAD(P)-dependent oxidoreductase n=1 Tax=Hellea balneolensis TaxID=287478 RepID=UPI0003FABC74|nr:SDR family oxidoreductase [Hellea balneolensis]
MDIYKDKICVVTGAASGIGRALALALAKSGAQLALSDINEDGLTETVNMVGGSNRVMSDIFDMADAQAIADYADKVEAGLGAADYVFNVAGLTRVGNFVDTPLASMEKVMDVNYWGVVRMTKAFMDQLLSRKGTVVNISSVFGFIGYAGQTHYCASKFAVRGFTETLAQELKGTGVGVCCVHPGGVATNVARNAEVDKMPFGDATREELDANFDKMAITSPEKAAQIILKGAAKKKRRILIGGDARFISLVSRLFPVTYSKVLEKYQGQNVILGNRS